VAGAELFADHAAAAAARLRLSVVAVAVLLAGAEPEELVTAVLASSQDRPGLAAGNAVGANLTMLTAALGLAALARPLPVGRRTRRYALAAAVAGLLAVLALLDGRVGRVEGALLLLAYGAGVAAVWRLERTPPAIGELADLDDDDPPSARALVLVGAGLVLMTAGGAAAVDGATRLVQQLGRTDEAVGLVVLGLATTTELFALVLAAARAGVEEVAVAAVVGSSAYNATTTLGAAAAVAPLRVEGLLLPALAAAALPLAVPLLGRSGHLGRAAGAGLAAAYALFVALVVTGL
jgi:cation:H+ antiporter